MLFVVDAETDGLYGPVWAIGVVVMDESGVLDIFSGEAERERLTSQWVLENVLPNVSLPNYPTLQDLRDAFWEFWMKYRERGAICVADYGSPVESGLFRTCVLDDHMNRQWLGPYPLHEVGTVLLTAGIDPDTDRVDLSGLPNLRPHNPLDDALASGTCWFLAMEKLGPGAGVVA